MGICAFVHQQHSMMISTATGRKIRQAMERNCRNGGACITIERKRTTPTQQHRQKIHIILSSIICDANNRINLTVRFKLLHFSCGFWRFSSYTLLSMWASCWQFRLASPSLSLYLSTFCELLIIFCLGKCDGMRGTTTKWSIISEN